jgi:hypothetical protein
MRASLLVSRLSLVARCIMGSVFSGYQSKALQSSHRSLRRGWTKFGWRSRLVLDPKRSDK